MEANVQYNDFKGTAAADISDSLSVNFSGDSLESFADFFKLDKNRFKIIGISFYGGKSPSISLLCVDLEESTTEKEYIVSMRIDWPYEEHPIDTLFKRFEVVLHEKFDEKYLHLDYDNEVRYEDFHELEENKSNKD